MAAIPLTGKGIGRFIFVDDNDLALVERYRWYLVTWGKKEYAATTLPRGNKPRATMLGNLLLGRRKGFVVDHKDGDTYNYRRSNLRWATVGQNNANRRTFNGPEGYRGITYYKRTGRYAAQIKHDGMALGLGYFDTAIEAARAYDAAALKFHGEFTVLNFAEEL